MTLLTDLRNTFTLSNQTLYEEIKAVRYNEKLIELEVMEKLLEIKDDMIRWCTILDIDEYVFERCHDCNSLDYQELQLHGF